MFSKYLTQILVFNKLSTSTEHSTLKFFNNDGSELCISYQNGDADKASTFSEGFRIGVSLFYRQSLKPTVWRIYGNYKSEEITQTRLFTW